MPWSTKRFSRIMTNANDTARWVDEEGHHPMGADAKNSLQGRTTNDVLLVIRNALAHGNIVYLNERGLEQRDTSSNFSGFYLATKKRRKRERSQ
jgi:hypothetical protein